jgi:hypothetical protein
MRSVDRRITCNRSHRGDIMIEHENRRQGSVASAVTEVIVGGLQHAVECCGWVIEVGVSLLISVLRG